MELERLQNFYMKITETVVTIAKTRTITSTLACCIKCITIFKILTRTRNHFTKGKMIYNLLDFVTMIGHQIILPALHERTKHIEVDYHFIRQHLQSRVISTVYLLTKENSGRYNNQAPQ